MITLAGCRKAELDSGNKAPVPDMSAPIEWTVTTEVQAKGLDYMDNSDRGILSQRFGVFGYWNNPDSPVNDPYNMVYSSPFIKNSEMEYTVLEGGTYSWSCKPKAYWPYQGSATFFAYAPYQKNMQPYEDSNGNNVEPMLRFPAADYESGLLRASFSPSTRVTNQADFCIACPQFDKTKENGPINLLFKHTLTRLRFYVNIKGTKEANSEYLVSDFTLSGIMGTNTFTYQNNADMPFKWDEATDATKYKGSYQLTHSGSQLTSSWVKFKSESAGDPSIDDYTFINELDNGRLYLLPQTLTENAKVEFSISIYKSSGENYVLSSVLPPTTIFLPTTTSWEVGKTISYLITLNYTSESTEFIETSITPLITDWTDSGNTPPEHTLE